MRAQITTDQQKMYLMQYAKFLNKRRKIWDNNIFNDFGKQIQNLGAIFINLASDFQFLFVFNNTKPPTTALLKKTKMSCGRCSQFRIDVRYSEKSVAPMNFFSTRANWSDYQCNFKLMLNCLRSCVQNKCGEANENASK